jgi:hypothetical protein
MSDAWGFDAGQGVVFGASPSCANAERTPGKTCPAFKVGAGRGRDALATAGVPPALLCSHADTEARSEKKCLITALKALRHQKSSLSAGMALSLPGRNSFWYKAIQSKWLNLTKMAEISHSGNRNFSAPAWFQRVEEIGKVLGPCKGRKREPRLGGEYEIREILGVAGGTGASADVFASAGQGGDWRWSGWRCGGSGSGLCLRLLWLLSLCLRALRILWGRLVCGGTVRGSGAVVPRSWMVGKLGLC